MKPKQPKGSGPKKGRSAAQRDWTAAVGLASKAWEGLSDAQRLAWNAEGKRRRSTGQKCFVGINARRLRDGQALLTEVPTPAACRGKLLLRRLVIGNRGGKITVKLELTHTPGVRITVWASRPCNRGVSRSPKCPRLGELPAPVGGVSDVTRLYFQKHGEYIKRQRIQLVGKRIFIRTRVELDGGPGLWEGTNAVVPGPEGESRRHKGA